MHAFGRKKVQSNGKILVLMQMIFSHIIRENKFMKYGGKQIKRVLEKFFSLLKKGKGVFLFLLIGNSLLFASLLVVESWKQIVDAVRHVVLCIQRMNDF